MIKLPEIIILYNEHQTPTISGGKFVTLAAGRPPKQRAATYVKLDSDTQSAKLIYNTNISYVFA